MPPPDPDEPEDDGLILSFAAEDPRYTKPRRLVEEKRKNWENPNTCDHKAKLWVDRTVRTIECDKCKAVLDPIEVVFLLARHYEMIEWKYDQNRELARKDRARIAKEAAKRAERQARKGAAP